MKQMIYQREPKIEVLFTGFYKSIRFYILNLGTHPTAYIDHKIDFDKNEVECHGGVTFNENHLRIENNEVIEGNFIGWDYAHFGDFVAYVDDNSKKWTTEEIFEEVKKVIDGVINHDK